MKLLLGKWILKLLASVICISMLSGCSLLDFKSRLELGVKWVSPEGKTKEELEKDQKECTHEAMLMTAPPFPGELGRGGADIQAFDNCMRSKGWVKE